MPSISEKHTIIFPMYYDLDMKLPIDALGTDTIQSIARVVIKQTLRFYPDHKHEYLGRCIVTDKTGCAVKDEETGLYKHGVHIHFPHIMVDVNGARQIRMGVLNGLTSYMGSWKELLGVDPGDKWDDMVDDAVYNTGLRMLCSPKASKCKLCTAASGSCSHKDGCRGQNKGYIIDVRYYKLCMVLNDAGERDVDYARSLKNVPTLLRDCSVRAPLKTEPTEGYAIYPGCPQLSSTHLTAASKGKKRKIAFSALNGTAKRPTDRRFKDEITDAKAKDIARKYLLKVSPKYVTCPLKLSRSGNTIRVNLYGDDAKYCTNKMGYHHGSNVYMDIVRKGLTANAFMKCYCPCKTTVGRSGHHVQCGQLYKSTQKALDNIEVDVLFVNPSDSDDPIKRTERIMFFGTAASARKIHDDKEFLRLSGVDC